MVGIYKITNKENGKVYIGQATNLHERLKEHQQERFVPIDMWINMLGAEAFNFEILEETTLEELDEKEKEYIKLYNSIENGYNKQEGGFNNSIGEGNGRAKLTEKDIIFIREAYKNHIQPKEIYEKFKDKVTLNQFQAVWQGRSWRHIMPEVFTEENKKYYISGQFMDKAVLSIEEVINYRTYYINHTRKETYLKFLQEKGPVLKERTFEKILIGDVRDTSIYKTIPVYKKSKKCWELNDEPVSTIPESGE